MVYKKSGFYLKQTKHTTGKHCLVNLYQCILKRIIMDDQLEIILIVLSSYCFINECQRGLLDIQIMCLSSAMVPHTCSLY